MKLLLISFLPTLATAMGLLLTATAKLLIWFVTIIANIGPSEILIGHVPLAMIASYYCLIIFAAFVYLRKPHIKSKICFIAALILIVWISGLKWTRTHPAELQLTVLDVGHGQTIVADLPKIGRILFDAGSLTTSNVGERVVIPFLRYTGNDQIESIVVSHGDIDHINGIAEITAGADCEKIIVTEQFLADTKKYGPEKQLADYLKNNAIKIEVATAVIAQSPQLKVRAIWPPENIEPTASDNDKSMVVLIEYADKKILLCSDIEQTAQNALLEAYPDLKPDIFIAPHHGSARTIDQLFLNTLNPEIVISSCGFTALDKHRLLQPPEKSKAYCTAANGAITIKIDTKGNVTTSTDNSAKK